MSSDELRTLFDQACSGSRSHLARLLTAVDAMGPQVFKLLPELLQDSSATFRIGITGPPGAGKSTLISQLLKQLRSEGLNVAVLAVDPSSPFTKGAILGDRIRYSEHFLDPQVFIRSLGTRGSLGGLSASAYLMLRVLDQMNFDVVLIETVGVGQTELEVVNVADEVVVVLVPESGDSIQAMKAGLTEIASVFVVNKADRPGADSLRREIQASVKMTETPREIPVLKTSASTGEGVAELAALLRTSRTGAENAQAWRSRRQDPTRLQQEALALVRAQLEAEAWKRIEKIQTPTDIAALF